MTAPHRQDPPNSFEEAFAAAIAFGNAAIQSASEALQSASENLTTTTATFEQTVVPTVQQFVEQGTETVGNFITPFAEHPFIQYATTVPGLRWVLAALGQIDVARIHDQVDQLRQQYPLHTSEQLAERIIVDTTLNAAGIGLVTNIVPAAALSMLAIDLAAITALQAEMIYRIATVYGFDLTEPARRGEVLMILGLAMGGSSILKTGLSFVDLVPVAGAVVEASSDAALLYSLGYAACRFYEAKRTSQN